MFEVEADGRRAMVYLPGDGTVLLRARSGANITPAYLERAALSPALGRPSVLDGEITALGPRGVATSSGSRAGWGLAGSPGKAARIAASVPVHLVLFDAVYLGQDSLVRKPYTERRAVLESPGLDGPYWSGPAATIGHGPQALEMTRTAGLEGLVAKRLTSLYEPGARSRAWSVNCTDSETRSIRGVRIRDHANVHETSSLHRDLIDGRFGYLGAGLWPRARCRRWWWAPQAMKASRSASTCGIGCSATPVRRPAGASATTC
ncbi:hypothetical protein ACIQWV_36640 [Streptomyces sp. NPDC098085]|uniref:ATP-dependent DNA ligase n=1 Tax=Streptomyces sp. NPDC098085 TaxID=3366094 RepID=UPI00380CA04B